MKKNFIVFLGFFGVLLLFYWKSLFVFFAQDDFILIHHFSGYTPAQNLVNVFGKPTVTHWRPIHNLYFFVSGSIFGKNYFFYHLLTFVIQALIGLLIFKIVKKIALNEKVALLSSFLYLVNSSHFISLTWISGGAVLIGTLIFLISFWFFLINKKIYSLIFLLLSFLASEAMVFAIFIFFFWSFLNKGVLKNLKFISINFALAVCFLIIRFLYLTPESIFDTYKISISPAIINSLRYYVLRIIGLGEGPEVKFWRLLILAIFLVVGLFIKKKNLHKWRKNLLLAAFIILIGLFPFVLISNHLSPHYMNISIFGFGFLIAMVVSEIPKIILFLFLALYSLSSFFIVSSGYQKSWVVVRANIAKGYINKIEKINYKEGAVIKFGNSSLSDSKEAYVSLGTGDAIKFWFQDKKYKTCFEFLNDCGEN